MLALLGISTIASLVASTLLGVRLLRLYGRTRQLPELFMGTAFLGAGVVGYVCMLLGSAGAQQMPAELARAFFLVGYVLISGGVILTYLFVWRVFRPDALLARAWIGIVCPVILVTSLPVAMPTLDSAGAALVGPSLFIFWLGHAARIGCGVWGALEAGHYWLAMRKRLRLGLAEAVVTNRIGLWGLASLGSFVVFLSSALASASGDSMESIMSPAQIVLVSSVSLAAVVCQWLAFLPPAWYLRWVEARAPQPG